jgi:hypothetical protein
MSDNKRIAKNTFFLSMRMLLMMVISLYTSRVVLDILGFEDFGIYNVVGGIVVVLGFLNGALRTAALRFITVSLSGSDENSKRKVFSEITFINILLSVIVLLVGETIGLWFLYTKLQIPADRFDITLWVYQISLLTVVINIISVPYDALIIAHERMKVFAYFSLFDAISKLILVMSLTYIRDFDKLLLYALFVFGITVINRLLYQFYCIYNFKESRIIWSIDRSSMFTVFKFISWSAYGSIASVGFTEGVNILLNMFFGPTINAARGVSVQVQNAIVAFADSFQTAINPQLIKSVSAGNFSYSKTLLISSSKYSFFVLCVLSLPLIIETDFVLNLWLKQVPAHTVNFVRLMLVIRIWGVLANPLRIVNQAEGAIRKFQFYEGSVLLLIVPASYFALLYLDFPEIVFIVHLIIELLVQLVRLKIVLPKIGMSLKTYIFKVYLRIIPVFIIPLVATLVLYFKISESTYRFILILLIVEIQIFVLIYLIGLNPLERVYLKEFIRKKIKKNG